MWPLSVVVFLTLAFCGPAIAQTVEQPRAHRVLALYADDRFLPALQQVDDGLRSALKADTTLRIEYYGEFLDAVRFGTRADLEVLRAFLRDKYRETPPDVVVAGARPALEFLLDNRETLFTTTPIVHVALTAGELPTARLDDRVVGLTSSWDLLRPLDLALRLKPGTRHVAVVGGVSPRERSLLASVEEAANRLDHMKFTWLNRHTFEEVQVAVASLGSDTVVLFASLLEDAAGRVRISRDVLEILAARSTAPIFAFGDTLVGHGVVAVTGETFGATGREAGVVVRRILGGQAPRDAVRDVRLPIETIVDWRQLKKWNISEADLPAGTEVRFREPTLWQAYRTEVIIAAAVGATQLLLVAALAVALQRRRVAEATRQAAEVRASGLRDELAHATRVTLLGELAATLAHEINQPLAAILNNANATRRWLKADQPNLEEIRATIDDIIADDKRASEIIHRMRALLKKGEQTRTRFDVVKAVRDVAALLQGELIVGNITLELDLPAHALFINGDEVATQQVLLNLMLNGVQSIVDGGGQVRLLQVRASHVDGTVVLSVHDTGNGVSAEMRAQLFEPFVSTKARGLGMGLAICRRIAEAHGGSLELGASPTGGATFVLALPSPVTAA